ncbi:phosphoribosylformylglycinamidine synthase subunit PurS [soil metagenome]
MIRVVVAVMLKPEILDPQGQAVERALPSMDLSGVQQVRIGKHIELELDPDVGDPEALAEQVADKLLANPVIEEYTVTVQE